MCACKRHVGSRFDIGTNYRITADEQLLGSALATCSTVSYDNQIIGGIYFGVSRKQDIL